MGLWTVGRGIRVGRTEWSEFRQDPATTYPSPLVNKNNKNIVPKPLFPMTQLSLKGEESRLLLSRRPVSTSTRLGKHCSPCPLDQHLHALAKHLFSRWPLRTDDS